MSDPSAMLGSGAAAQAARLLRGRKGQLDELETKAVGDAPASPPQSGDNSAFFKGFTPEERARQQKKLAELLRKRE